MPSQGRRAPDRSTTAEKWSRSITAMAMSFRVYCVIALPSPEDKAGRPKPARPKSYQLSLASAMMACWVAMGASS